MITAPGGPINDSATQALLSGVPAAAVAYSSKARGVFETCGQGHHVADLRHLDTVDVVDQLWQSWASRHDAEASLQRTMATVQMQVEAQMDEILIRCTTARQCLRAMRLAA